MAEKAKSDDRAHLMQERLAYLYAQYNRRQWVSPDPLQFLYAYPAVADREVVGLVASSLAYGRVAQILKSIERVLTRMGASPGDYVRHCPESRMKKDLADFKHRFTPGSELVELFLCMRQMINTHGSLNANFCAGLSPADETISNALSGFSNNLGGTYLTPAPENGSACKRMNLYLRWMVRCDDVDPGGWTGVRPGQLIIPLDVHMGRIARSWRMTRRKPSDLRTALEITRFFRKVEPDDPIRYDFVLTRFGIRDDMPAELAVAPARTRTT